MPSSDTAPDRTDVVARESIAYQSLKTVYHAFRRAPDRLMHRRRHRAALDRLAAIGAPRSILVVCYGNICRSPYLAAVLQRELPGIQVASGGFVGAGRPVPENSRIACARRGIDMTHFRSRPVSARMARSVDLVIVMDAIQRARMVDLLKVSPARVIVAGDLDPRAAPTRGIVDPWMRSLDVFESSFDRLDRCAATIVSALGRPSQQSAAADCVGAAG
jgi:protein-tyrosine-phosphatase